MEESDVAYNTDNALFESGIKLLNAKRYEEAYSVFIKLTEMEPDNIVAWNLRGLSLMEMDRHTLAEDCFNQALSIDNNDVPTIGNMYKCMNALNKYADCIHFIDKYLSSKPDNVDALITKGRALAEMGKTQEALRCFERVTEYAPQEPTAWANRGAALGDLGLRAEAILCYESALRLKPNEAVIWFNKASAEEKLYRKADAVHSLERFLVLSTNRWSTQIEEAKERLARLKSDKNIKKITHTTQEEFSVGRILHPSIRRQKFRVKEVKKGGFGVVYIVKNDAEETLALKSFQSSFLWSEENRLNFVREALTWVMFKQHPNIVHAMFLDKIEGFPFLTLEYVKGGDLSELLSEGPLSINRGLELGIQFCDGMTFINNNYGVVHRDIKPSNCLLTEEGNLKIADFGLARAFDLIQKRNMDSSMIEEKSNYQTTVCGTPNYMAPEQFVTGMKIDTRTDIYAFGVMFYEMLTGELPLDGRAAKALIDQSTNSSLMPTVLLKIIRSCVEQEMNKRPSSFEELGKNLRKAYEEITGLLPFPQANAIPGQVADWNVKGIALETFKLYDEAIECFDEGIKIAPDSAYLLMNKGATLSRLSRNEEALICYDKALALDSNKFEAWGNKANALSSLGRHQEAIQCFDRALKLAPRDPVLLVNKAGVFIKMEKFSEALSLLEKAIQAGDSDSKVFENKGVVLIKLGRVEEGLNCIKLAVDMDPLRNHLREFLGDHYFDLERYDEALQCYEQALKLSPMSAELLNKKGNTLKAMNRLEGAKVCYMKAEKLMKE